MQSSYLKFKLTVKASPFCCTCNRAASISATSVGDKT